MSRRLAVLVAMSASTATLLAADLQQPTFRASVDVAAIDVRVVDSGGNPVDGLTSADFDVRINGRRRAVVTVEAVRVAAGPGVTTTRRPAGPGPAARNIWPSPVDAPARTFIIAIDAASLDAGDGASVAGAVSAFLDRLTPQDIVGVVTLPRGPSLRPTVDHAAVRRVLATIGGTRAMRPNPFHLTPAEAADIVAEMDRAAIARMAGGRGASLVTPMVLRQVQARECPASADTACTQGIVIDADAQLRQIEDDVSESLGGLRTLLSLLAGMPGGKTVVVLSGGMPVNDRSGGWHTDGSEVRSLGRAMAEAQSTVYAVHVDRVSSPGQSAEARVIRPATTITRDRELQQRLLASFTSTGGGALVSAVTDAGEMALDRILLESSATYTLGVVTEPGDFDVRVHELRVAVSDRRLVVRSPRYVQLRSRN